MKYFKNIKTFFKRRTNTQTENETMQKIYTLRLKQIDEEIKRLNDEKEEILLHIQNLNLDF